MIQTGFGKLDSILGGGLKNGTITDISGANGTGKTQLTLQIVANLISHGGTVFYQDTTGSFRPERLVEMLKAKGFDSSFLDKVTVGRITNTSEQINNITKISESDFSLIVIDNVTDLFSFEYSKEDQMLEKTNQFAKYMKQLSKTALDKKIPIVVVNMMRKIADSEQENLDPVISIFTHVKIKLVKKPTSYEGEVFSGLRRSQFLYKITKEGLVDLT